MKQQLCIFLTFFMFSIGFAQKAPLKFKTQEYDFGRILELEESVSVDFEFINVGSKSVVIKSIDAACHCTVPEYPKDTIKSGEEGIVKVVYHRYNNPNKFEKSLTVVGIEDTIEFKIPLLVKGYVIPREKGDVAHNYSKKLGSMWVKSDNLMMGNILTNEPQQKSFKFYNGGEETLTFSTESLNLPSFIKVKFSSDEIPSKSYGILSVTYDGAKRNDFGYVIDTLKLISNDDILPTKRFILRANIIQHFSEDVDIASAPHISIPLSTHDLGYITKGGEKEGDFKITNTGKTALKIHNVKSFCECITILENKNCEIAPHQTKSVKYKINSSGYAIGRKMKKTIIVYSTDPTHPERKVTVRALVK